MGSATPLLATKMGTAIAIDNRQIALSSIGDRLYVGGRIEGVNGAKVQIRTPVGAIGVRGTTVWGAQSTTATESSC